MGTADWWKVRKREMGGGGLEAHHHKKKKTVEMETAMGEHLCTVFKPPSMESLMINIVFPFFPLC